MLFKVSRIEDHLHLLKHPLCVCHACHGIPECWNYSTEAVALGPPGETGSETWNGLEEVVLIQCHWPDLEREWSTDYTTRNTCVGYIQPNSALLRLGESEQKTCSNQQPCAFFRDMSLSAWVPVCLSVNIPCRTYLDPRGRGLTSEENPGTAPTPLVDRTPSSLRFGNGSLRR